MAIKKSSNFIHLLNVNQIQFIRSTSCPRENKKQSDYVLFDSVLTFIPK